MKLIQAHQFKFILCIPGHYPANKTLNHVFQPLDSKADVLLDLNFFDSIQIFNNGYS